MWKHSISTIHFRPNLPSNSGWILQMGPLGVCQFLTSTLHIQYSRVKNCSFIHKVLYVFLLTNMLILCLLRSTELLLIYCEADIQWASCTHLSIIWFLGYIWHLEVMPFNYNKTIVFTPRLQIHSTIHLSVGLWRGERSINVLFAVSDKSYL